MECEKVEKLLSDYLDHSLDGIDRAGLDKHLAKCKKCGKTLDYMTRIDNMLKLKANKKPSKKYWDTYWPRLEDKLLVRAANPFSKARRWNNLFIPKFSPAFSGVLIALLLLVNGILYVNVRQLSSLQCILSERQEEMQKEMSVYLTKLDGNVTITRNVFEMR